MRGPPILSVSHEEMETDPDISQFPSRTAFPVIKKGPLKTAGPLTDSCAFNHVSPDSTDIPSETAAVPMTEIGWPKHDQFATDMVDPRRTKDRTDNELEALTSRSSPVDPHTSREESAMRAADILLSSPTLNDF